MAIKYKADILARLKDRGYSSTRLRKEKLFGERTIQDIRTQAEIPYKALNRLCELLDCEIGDIIEYVQDEK